MVFADRTEAGRLLARRLEHLRGADVIVLGLPRGGVPVAFEVAMALGAPLDVILVRKLGVPAQPELGMGAIGEDGIRIVNPAIVRHAGVPPDGVDTVEARERAELERRAAQLRGHRPRLPLTGRTAIVVDDGIATGSTALAACAVARAHGAIRVVLATPVAPRGWQERIGGAADELVAVDTPAHFYAIGQFYDDFAQVDDAEVVECLDRAAARAGLAPRPMTRLPLLTEADLDDAQRRVWDSITRGRRGSAGLVDEAGALVGPFNAMLHSPAVGERISALGEALRFDSSIERRLLELAIITVGARWRANFEWWAHSRMAREAGVPDPVIDAIRDGEAPAFRNDDERVVHGFVSALLQTGDVDDVTYAAAADLLGPRGLVELVALVGYYTLISFVLDAFAVPAPPGAAPAWPR